MNNYLTLTKTAFITRDEVYYLWVMSANLNQDEVNDLLEIGGELISPKQVEADDWTFEEVFSTPCQIGFPAHKLDDLREYLVQNDML